MRSQGLLINKIIHFYQHVLVKIGLWDGVLHDDCKKKYVYFLSNPFSNTEYSKRI